MKTEEDKVNTLITQLSDQRQIDCVRIALPLIDIDSDARIIWNIQYLIRGANCSRKKE